MARLNIHIGPRDPEAKLVSLDYVFTIEHYATDGVTVRALRYLINHGLLPAVKIGGRWFTTSHNLGIALDYFGELNYFESCGGTLRYESVEEE